MNERIHRALDGEIDRDRLSPTERAAVDEYEAMFAAVDGALGRHPSPDVVDAVMARIAELEPADAGAPMPAVPSRRGRIAEAVRWLWTPRPISLRPASALAGVAFLIGTIGLASMLMPDADTGPVVATAPASSAADVAAATIFVHFRLDAPDARSVHLAGDFTDWEPSYELNQSMPGVWTIVVPLTAGVHDYAFVVDGETWTPDPLARRVADGFGGENSRLSLLPPERMQV